VKPAATAIANAIQGDRRDALGSCSAGGPSGRDHPALFHSHQERAPQTELEREVILLRDIQERTAPGPLPSSESRSTRSRAGFTARG
jgi:hypothetical protein